MFREILREFIFKGINILISGFTSVRIEIQGMKIKYYISGYRVCIDKSIVINIA